MKVIDLPARAHLHRKTAEALKLLDEKKPDEAEAICAELRKDPGRTCILAGVEARLALVRGDRAGARRHLEDGLKMAAAGDLVFNRIAVAMAGMLGDGKLAERALRVALHRTPSDALIRKAAGEFCYRRGHLEAARTHFLAAVNLKPRFLDAMVALAIVLRQTGEGARAAKVLDRARAFDPDIRTRVLNVGNRLYEAEDYKGAVDIYAWLARLEPDYPGVYSNLGSAYRHLHDFAKARNTLRRSALLEPESDGAYYNLGNLEKEAASVGASVRALRQAIYCRPDKAQLHWNLSLSLLADGQLGEGFREYEWRWETESFPTRKRIFAQPEWKGEPLEGRTLFIIAEQGIGDALQFLRFLPEAVRRARSGGAGGRIIVEVHEDIRDLCADYAGMVELVSRNPGGEPAFDCHIAQLSLPLVLGVETLDDLPVAPAVNSIGPDRFPVPGLDRSYLNVGIVWGGNPEFPGDNIRSSRVEYYAPLFGLEGIRCYSLQKGPREADLASAPPGLIPLSRDIRSFADTVSIIRQLDVTVTTCTSVAHLAGAMGCPVHVLLSHNPDWRWLQHRDDSPWYPSARLFRQRIPGDWPGVIAHVAGALRELHAQKAGA